jgi:hypothetical protein
MSEEKKHSRLNRAQVYKLCGLIDREYAKANCTDALFAVSAAAELGFSLNENHVTHCRLDLGIPSYRQARQVIAPAGSVLQRLAALEFDMDKLRVLLK